MLGMKKRILLFVFDGSGLGHLRRMARIAEELEGHCLTLLITGMQEATWIVPQQCQVIILPSRKWIKANRRDLEVDVGADGMRSTLNCLDRRAELIASITSWFDPHAIIVDYLPFGKGDELRSMLGCTNARKYLILRGIVDTSDYPIFHGDSSRKLAEFYDRVLVTCDARIVNVSLEYQFVEATNTKVTYTGYVLPPKSNLHAVRALNGIGDSNSWVICDAGGGLNGEALANECIRIAHRFPQTKFDVILGPFSDQSLITLIDIENCRIHKLRTDLPAMHAGADVVISAGGYNTLVEAASGGARLLVMPNQIGDDDEQARQAIKMATFYPVKLIRALDNLYSMLCCELDNVESKSRPEFLLQSSGAQRVREIICQDLFQEDEISLAQAKIRQA